MFRRIRSEPDTRPGALNWATGETVAVKEIQLSNIPRGELGQIMVRPPPYPSYPHFHQSICNSGYSLRSTCSRISTYVHPPFATLIIPLVGD
jgi:hypothetical protein